MRRIAAKRRANEHVPKQESPSQVSFLFLFQLLKEHLFNNKSKKKELDDDYLDFYRHSTRTRKVTNYNEDNAQLWGLSEDEELTPYTPTPTEDEGDVIESVHDHRRQPELGNLLYNNDVLLLK